MEDDVPEPETTDVSQQSSDGPQPPTDELSEVKTPEDDGIPGTEDSESRVTDIRPRDREGARSRKQPGSSARGQNRSSKRGPGANHGGDSQESGSDWTLYLYDLLSSVGIVVLIGALLFTASGVWPPMVAVESGSMEPVMERGDLVFVMEADRFPGDGAHESGVVTARMGQTTGYEKFGGYGDVIVFEPDGNERRTPVIHRSMFWVEEGENWVNDANPEYLDPRGSSCDDVAACPAPHAGFITKGDNNGRYDQVNRIANGPIKPEWVVGTAEYSLPYLGEIRLGAQAGATNVTWDREAMGNRTAVTNATSR